MYKIGKMAHSKRVLLMELTSNSFSGGELVDVRALM